MGGGGREGGRERNKRKNSAKLKWDTLANYGSQCNFVLHNAKKVQS